jgi:antitoxin VapB
MAQTAKLFTNGGSQAVRLPAEFRFEGTEVNIRKDPVTGEIILSASQAAKSGWTEFFDLRDEMLAAGEIPQDFLLNRDQGHSERRAPFEDWTDEELGLK